MADVSRTQFDEDKDVIKKIFQQGVFAADADLNEQIDIVSNYQERILSGICGGVHTSFEGGFEPVGTGATLEITIKAGFLAAILDDGKRAVLLRLAEDYTLTGFNAWSGARTDYVYLDITEATEFSATEDPSIINPIIGEETCRDIRISYTINIAEDSMPSSPPAGHSYVQVGRVIKTSGSAINADEVFNDLYETNLLRSQQVQESYDKSNLRVKVLPIGPWDMSTIANVNVTHNLTLTSIRSADVKIMSDGSSSLHILELGGGAISGYFNIQPTTVYILREAAGFFDGVNFDSTTDPANRGWITIWYEV